MLTILSDRSAVYLATILQVRDTKRIDPIARVKRSLTCGLGSLERPRERLPESPTSCQTAKWNIQIGRNFSSHDQSMTTHALSKLSPAFPSLGMFVEKTPTPNPINATRSHCCTRMQGDFE